MPQTNSIVCPGTLSNAEKLSLQPKSLVYDIAQKDPLVLGCGCQTQCLFSSLLCPAVGNKTQRAFSLFLGSSFRNFSFNPLRMRFSVLLNRLRAVS